MKIRDILNDAEWLKITDLDNMFDVYPDGGGNYVYNLNDTVYVSMPKSQMLKYVCDQKMHWPLISYKLYGTTRLAWLLVKLNDVQPEDMFRAKLPSETVRYIDQNMVQTIIRGINEYGEA